MREGNQNYTVSFRKIRDKLRFYEVRLEADAGSGGVVRLSILPSQGSDPGFKSRPEHIPAIQQRRCKYVAKIKALGFGSPVKFSSFSLGLMKQAAFKCKTNYPYYLAGLLFLYLQPFKSNL